ncbi:MAG: uroporphyrinogen-III C-methyltransferase [Gammaproteobacteria bacterium]|nr:uroporphyrinogen-III C-methyltransferase [Gammaproteobacteria bacterium]
MSPDKPEPTEPTDDITDPPDADTDVVEQAEAEADAPDKDTEVAEQAEADAPPTPAEESATEDKPAVPARERGGKRRLLLIVLGVAVITAFAAGYVWWQLRNLTGVPEEVALSRVDLAQLSARLERLETEDRRRARDLDSAIADLKTQNRSLEELSVRSGRIERSVANLPGVADEARTAWLVAEAEYYLRVANAQINLASNVDVALRALILADAKLRDLADPRMTTVREKISDEVAALRAVPQPDRAGVALTLQSLARNFSAMPLRSARPDQFRREAPEPATSEAGMDRAIQSVKDAFSSIVSVRQTNLEAAPELSADDQALLIRTMDLEVQVAKLAFLRGERELYRQSLTQVRERVTASFDTDSARVRAALDTLTKLEAVEFGSSLPDITGSLTLLTQLTASGIAQ